MKEYHLIGEISPAMLRKSQTKLAGMPTLLPPEKDAGNSEVFSKLMAEINTESGDTDQLTQLKQELTRCFYENRHWLMKKIGGGKKRSLKQLQKMLS